MNPERWPGEPWIERLTATERDELQVAYLQQWLGRRRRARYDAIRTAPATIVQTVPTPPPPLSGNMSVSARRVAASQRGVRRSRS